MSVRSLNGLNGTNTNLIITNNYVARLPIEQTQATSLDPVIIGLKGITGFTGSAGNVLKSNSANNALEWATDNNEIITATLPLLKTGIDISLKGITGFTGAGKILKVNSNNDAFEWATDTDTTYSVVAPLNLNGNQISLTGLTTLGVGDAYKVIKVNSAGNALEYATDTDTTYSVVAPLNLNGNQISLTGLTTLGVGDAYKVIKVNSAGNALEYATDNTDPSKWTLNGAILYPNSIASNVVIGTTSNPNSRKFYVNGDAECENLYAENILLNNGTTQSYIRFYDTDATNPEYVDLKAPADLNANYTLTLPSNITGTLAVVSQIPTIPSAIWVVNSNEIYPISSAVDTLKMKTIQNPTYSGTKLEANTYINTNYGWAIHGSIPEYTLAIGPIGNIAYPMLGNKSGGFNVHINNVGDAFNIDTSRNATLYGNRLDIGAHLRLETVSTNNHYLTDPNSAVGSSNNEYVLYYNTASTLSILNAGDPTNGEVRLSIAGSPMFSVDSGSCKVLTSEFQTPRFKIVSNGSETYINNPDPAANSSPFLTYHQDGKNLDFSTPVGGSANTSYIRHYIGSQLKLFIGGASTINYTPMVIEGALTITNNGDLTMYNGDIIMTGGDIDITGDIIGTNCEIDIDGGIRCEGVLSANPIGYRIGFQDTLPGYSPNYTTLVVEPSYGYFASATIPGSGSGGSYDGYWGNGSLGNASDRRLKTNINTIENPIDIIKRLRGVNFEWKCEGKPKGIQIGYIAQEVKEVIPSIVDFLPTTCEMCPDGTYGVAPMNISAVLVEGIKAQQIEIDTLKTELDTVKTELDTYKLLMDKLINSKTFVDFKKSL
jgi:hypothetical protein